MTKPNNHTTDGGAAWPGIATGPIHHHPLRAPHMSGLSSLIWYRMGAQLTLRGPGGTVTRLTRHQAAAHADLAQFVVVDSGVRSAMHISLSADDCELIGCALLDAAHHLRTVPATEINVADGFGSDDATPGHQSADTTTTTHHTAGA